MIKLHIKNRYLMLADIGLCFLAYVFIIGTIFPLAVFRSYFMNGLPTIIATALVYTDTLKALHLYKVDWLYASVYEYLLLLVGCFLAAIISVIVNLFFSPLLFPKLNIAAAVTISALICALRFFTRILCKLPGAHTKKGGKRTLIVGAGRLAVSLLRDIHDSNRLHYHVVGLIDDDDAKARQHIYGASVLGKRHDIPRICREKNVEEIIFAIYNLSAKDKAEMLDICSSTGKKVKILPGMEAILHDKSVLPKVREIEIEDLLEREPIILNNQLIQEDICGKVILVTGGGGSIGSELCRQIAKFSPRRLIILDIYENTTYELQNELEEKYPSLDIAVLIASVRDKERLMRIFETHRPEIVFHAAAHKHVPLMEYSPGEAIKNNVFGTYNTVCCAEEFGVRRFVLISTDKAVNPTNVMGATKRMCEMIVQSRRGHSKTDFVAVRFGNVLGSNGSVIPRFKKQILSGGPVTVTHPEITRFFMTIPEAAQLVLQAAAYAKGGEIFVLDMGSPVRIYDLARKMIRLSGLVPEKDVAIRFTGLRPGEKLYEELLMSEEGLTQTDHSKIFVGKPMEISPEVLSEQLKRLEQVSSADADAVKKVLEEIIPTYTPH